MNEIDEEWRTRIATLYRCQYDRAEAFEKEFKTCDLEVARKVDFDSSSIILICVVKDDLLKIKKFIEHYRNLGIKHFAFVDNNSEDGTFEFLMCQEDCDIYRCSQKYSSIRRVVWLNKLISIYGGKCWYVMVDSDEFIFYKGMEHLLITDLVSIAEKNNIYRISGFLLDMYSKGKLFGLQSANDFLMEYKFFDVKGYDIHNTDYGISIIGGPRKRLFRTENELAKCPIFRLNEDDIVASAHFLLPRIKSKNNPLWLAIGHYKFLDKNDEIKMHNAVISEIYSCGSREYKAYQSGIQKENIKFFFDEDISREFTDSSIIDRLPFIHFNLEEIDE